MLNQMKTLIWNQATSNPNTTFKFQEYQFTYNQQLQPIPVEVPEYIADILLQMTGRVHPCCHERDVPPMFKEVK
jgi:5'-3' exonuclease